MPTVTQIRKSAASASHCTVSKYAVYANCPFFDLCTGSGPLRSWYLGDEKNLEALTPFNGAPVPSPNSVNVTTTVTRLPPRTLEQYYTFFTVARRPKPSMKPKRKEKGILKEKPLEKYQ